MNSFIVTFCCITVAFTSGGVITHIPSGSVGVSADGVLVAGPAGSVHTSNGLHGQSAGVRVSGPSGDLHTVQGRIALTGPGHQENTWSLEADEGKWEHADNGEWHEEDHNDWNKEDGTWNSEEEKKWDEEEKVWDNEEQSLAHKISKRQAPARKINNAPEGRWNKELERYEYTSPRSDEGQYNTDWKNDNAYAPFGVPAWSHGFI